jgi:hypothetical protein
MPTGREGRSGAEGGFRPEAGGKVIDKAEKDEEDEDEKDEEETAEKSEKSPIVVDDGEIDSDDLMKAMDALDAAAEGVEEPEIDRRAELAKALEEGTLTDDERVELMDLLGANDPKPEDAINKGGEVEEPMEKGFEEVFIEEFSEDYDASPFLEKFGHAVGAGLDIMREDLSKGMGDQKTFNKALAKSMRGVAHVIQSQGDMIKSLSSQNDALAKRLGVVEQQPVGRKSAATPAEAKPLEKGFAGQEPNEIGLNEEQIFKGLHLLMAQHKDSGGRAKCGEPIDRAVTRFELSRKISKSMLAEIKEALAK